MGLFGDTPLNEIQTTIPNGTYRTICEGVQIITDKKENSLSFEVDGETIYPADKVIVTWLITDGEYAGDKQKQWISTYPRLSNELKAMLSGEQSTVYRNDARRLQKFFTGLGIPEEEWDQYDFAKSLPKTEAYIDLYTNQRGYITFGDIKAPLNDEGSSGGDDELMM